MKKPPPPFRPPVARPRGAGAQAAGAPRAALGRALSERGGCGGCIERRWPRLPPPRACGCGACAAPDTADPSISSIRSHCPLSKKTASGYPICQ